MDDKELGISEEIKNEAIELVNTEVAEWETATANVTKNVRWKVRDSIETFRKNYWGVFDNPVEGMVWLPVTEQAVENTIKNFDLDAKDLRQRAKNKHSRQFASVARAVIKDKLDKKFFGQDLDEAERSLAIDGTFVWKTWKGKNKEGKMDLMYEDVDLLNFYIDPLAKSIQETDAVIERSTPTVKEFKMISELANTEDVVGEERVAVYGDQGESFYTGKSNRVEVFERWGLMPKYFITGNKKDTEQIEGRIVTSGRGKSSKVHLIAKNPKGKKPYEECWYTKVPGRWYGRGVAEKVLPFQLWANMVKNIHIKRQKLAQLGIWKIRKGSGITPKILKGMEVNGAIQVNNMDDLEQVVMQEASQAGYQDMEDIKRWVEGVTSAVGSISPESLPSSAPATTTVINDRNNKSTFTLIREGIGFFLQRWMDRHAKEIIFEITPIGDILSIEGDDGLAKDLLERIVAKEALVQLERFYKQGIVPTEIEVERAFDKALKKLKGEEILVTLNDVMEAGSFETITYVTNEEMDISVMVQNIISMLPYISPESQGEYIEEAFDMMGINAPKIAPPQQPQDPELAPDNQAMSEQQISTSALTAVGQSV